jgi:dolichol-phosphate hexosyltransferase
MEYRKKITVLIPCYNEEAGIANVIKSFPVEKINRSGYDIEIMVIDNNSKDRTAEVAAAAGATVISETKIGKGNAMRRGFHSFSDDTDYVVMLDGDDTYRPEEVLRLVEILDSNFCDAVIGSRLGGYMTEGSMSPFNRLGNWGFTFLIRMFYKVNVTDVLTGYFAWKRGTLIRLRPHLVSSGFAIEMEMVTKMAKLGERVYSVPITYDKRAGSTNLRPIADGSRILLMFIKSLFWKPEPTSELAEQENTVAA